jgi:hypothetical protein
VLAESIESGNLERLTWHGSHLIEVEQARSDETLSTGTAIVQLTHE